MRPRSVSEEPSTLSHTERNLWNMSANEVKYIPGCERDRNKNRGAPEGDSTEVVRVGVQYF